MSPRALAITGLLALTPAAIYALASDHGRPFMLSSLFAPESNHSAIGLALLALGLILSPLVGFVAGWRLWSASRVLAAGLMLTALLLLGSGLTLRHPYATEWTLGPAVSGADLPPR